MAQKTGAHVWSLQKKLQPFLSADNGVKFESGKFPVGDFSWQIVAYPNGNRWENVGSCMLYLKLLNYAPEHPDAIVIAGFRLHCDETCSSSTFIEKYTRVHDSKGWTAKNLLLSDATKESIATGKLTFRVDVRILRILSRHERLVYEAPLKMYKNRFNLRWVVSDAIMTRMEYANVGKWFESGMYGNMWCFKVAPNGYSAANEGCCLLFLQLCALPPNISRLKCKVTLTHVESDTQWSIKKAFSYENGAKNTGWTDSKLSFEELRQHETITFGAKIEIVSVYDLRGEKAQLRSESTNTFEYTAQKTYDDGSSSLSAPRHKTSKSFAGLSVIKSLKQRVTPSSTTPTPSAPGYGGYGSHNYQMYFNDGYKQQQTQQQQGGFPTLTIPQDANDKKERETDDEDDDDDVEEKYLSRAETLDLEEESELELDTLDEMKVQYKFLRKEHQKLIKIVGSLKDKSQINDQLIAKLNRDIETLKNGAATMNAAASNRNDGDILDLF